MCLTTAKIGMSSRKGDEFNGGKGKKYPYLPLKQRDQSCGIKPCPLRPMASKEPETIGKYVERGLTETSSFLPTTARE